MLSHLKDAFPDSSESNYANDSNLCLLSSYCVPDNSIPLQVTNDIILKTALWGKYYHYLHFTERKKKKEQGSHKANKWQELFSESVFDQFALITVFSNIIIWLISLLCPDYSPQFCFDFVLA